MNRGPGPTPPAVEDGASQLESAELGETELAGAGVAEAELAGPVEPVAERAAGDVQRAERTAGLTARAESYARGSRAASTWAAYERQWARFRAWCAAAGEEPLPAGPLTVARFLADLAPTWRPATPADPYAKVVAGQVLEATGLRPGTLAGYLAAIAVAHHSAGHSSPTEHETVRRTMAGIRRHPGFTGPRRRAAARREPLLAILRTLRPDEHLADARDHALLLIGWKAALRTDDLARLQMRDLHAEPEGLRVHLARSKTDQHGTGITLGIAAPAPPTSNARRSAAPAGEDREVDEPAPLEDAELLDAGQAWVRWRDLLGAHGITTGPAWRAVDRYGRRPRAASGDRGLHRNAIAAIITRRASAAGLDDAARWGGHSLRRGFATEAIAAGVPERDVQHHGRWRSRASMDPYIDHARTFDATNPTRWLA